jgi:very-short-patch-repair endonuclease
MTTRAKTDKATMFLHALRVLAPNTPAPEEEHRFMSERRWRFDFAWTHQRVAVEVEGNAWHVRGGGKHMQDADLEKYNMAALYGWRVFRFSPAMIKNDPSKCIAQVVAALEAE